MPQAIAAGIVAAVGATGAVATAITVVTYAVSVLGSLALSNSQKRKAERQARAQYESSVVDRLVNVQNPVASRELVLGRVRKGGAIFFQSSVAPHNAVYVAVLALAGHEIAGVDRIYFNETPVDLDIDGNVTTAPWGRWNKITVKETDGNPVRTLAHTPIEGTLSVLKAAQYGSPQWFYPDGSNNVPYTLVGNVLTINDPDPAAGEFYTVTYQWNQFLSTARVFIHLGSPDQAADPRMQLLLPGTWTADHRARGVAYLECEFVYEETSFPTGLPNVTAAIAGAEVYDPRNGLTGYTDNPALMMRHVLLHPQFGKRTSLTAAEEARIAAAASACDIPTNYAGAVVSLYRGALVVPFGAPARDVLDDLGQSMAGEWAYAAGEIYIRAGVYQAPVMSLTEADLAVVQRSNDGSVSQSAITLVPHKPRNEKVNIIAARIWDSSSNYIETPVTPFRADALIAADGVELTQEVVMPAVTYSPQAYHICGVMLRDARDPLTVTLPFKMSAYPLELFDGVTLTIPRYGWSAKEFRVLGRTFSADGLVQLTLKETTASIYALGASIVPGGLADNTGLPKPWEISPPYLTGIFSGEDELIVQSDGTIVTSVRVTWLPMETSVVEGGSVEIDFQVLPDGEWRTVTVPGSATEARITGVNDLDVLVIRPRSRNSLAVSAWGPQSIHRVVGKTEPPPNIENLSIAGSVLSWSLATRVPDLAGFIFRFHYGNNLDWNSAAPMHTGVLTESPYDLITRPGGMVTIMGKALDTSGNESRATANIIMNLGDPPIANIIEQFDFRALGWPASQLYLPQDDYLLTDGSGNYLTDQDGNFLTTGFGALVQTEQSGWTEIDGVLQADALDSFYGDDNQTFYGADLDSFYEVGTYSRMVYVTGEITVGVALSGSIMTLLHETQGIDLRIDFRMSGPGSFYGADNQSFYGADADPLYAPPGPWQAWPGQLVAQNDAYQFRVTIGGGTTRGILYELIAVIDAPDMEETLQDVLIGVAGTTIPYTKPFTSIKTIQATLQANVSGAVTVETDKTSPLAPKINAFNDSHAMVGGATADITLKGY